LIRRRRRRRDVPGLRGIAHVEDVFAVLEGIPGVAQVVIAEEEHRRGAGFRGDRRLPVVGDDQRIKGHGGDRRRVGSATVGQAIRHVKDLEVVLKADGEVRRVVLLPECHTGGEIGDAGAGVSVHHLCRMGRVRYVVDFQEVARRGPGAEDDELLGAELEAVDVLGLVVAGPDLGEVDPRAGVDARGDVFDAAVVVELARPGHIVDEKAVLAAGEGAARERVGAPADGGRIDLRDLLAQGVLVHGDRRRLVGGVPDRQPQGRDAADGEQGVVARRRIECIDELVGLVGVAGGPQGESPLPAVDQAHHRHGRVLWIRLQIPDAEAGPVGGEEVAVFDVDAGRLREAGVRQLVPVVGGGIEDDVDRLELAPEGLRRLCRLAGQCLGTPLGLDPRGSEEKICQSSAQRQGWKSGAIDLRHHGSPAGFSGTSTDRPTSIL